MEELNRKRSFDAKALFVSYQVDKTNGSYFVCVKTFQLENGGESSSVFTSCSGWAWTVSPSLPCALIHRMCSMNSHPSPSCCCFLLECTPPFPEWPGFPLARLCRWTGRVASQQPVTPSFRELVSVLEQPMMESGDGREAGGSLVGRVGVRGGTGGDAVLLARKWG